MKKENEFELTTDENKILDFIKKDGKESSKYLAAAVEKALYCQYTKGYIKGIKHAKGSN